MNESTEVAVKRMWCDPGSGGNVDRMFRSHLFREENACVRCGTNKRELARVRAREKSGRADATGAMHFALIKSSDHDAKSGARVDAMAAAKRLLDAGFWPLWEHTPGRVVVDAGDRVCVYLSGVSSVVATARISSIEPWSRKFADAYPLILGGAPELVLRLGEVMVLACPVAVADYVDSLDCVGKNKRKWGAAFCGGMRSLSVHDYRLLTGQTVS
ncbi:MAG: hypothetical protein Q7K26_01325 [bacterium]|nr:hypothetical protein [bacterium]